MEKIDYDIAVAIENEHAEIGEFMANVYASLAGFPGRQEQPEYYALFSNLHSLTDKAETDLITARTPDGKLLGCVVYFGDMKNYGSGGTATSIENASGLRLLAVLPSARGNGIGKALTDTCIHLARSKNHEQIVLHTTEYMKAAWHLYGKMGFNRYEEIDFHQQELPVFGFHLILKS